MVDAFVDERLVFVALVVFTLLKLPVFVKKLVAKKLVVEALVAKRLVEVAFVVIRLSINALAALSTVAKNEVDVPLSVNEFAA